MRVKHTPGETCPKCDQLLEQGHPDLRYWFYEVKGHVDELGHQPFIDVHTSCVFRDEIQQNQAVGDGKSRLKWPFSKHNNLKKGQPYALAMDLFQIIDGVGKWSPGFFARIADYLHERSAPITWGGSWRHFADGPHFELDQGGSSNLHG